MSIESVSMFTVIFLIGARVPIPHQCFFHRRAWKNSFALACSGPASGKELFSVLFFSRVSPTIQKIVYCCIGKIKSSGTRERRARWPRAVVEIFVIASWSLILL